MDQMHDDFNVKRWSYVIIFTFEYLYAVVEIYWLVHKESSTFDCTLPETYYYLIYLKTSIITIVIILFNFSRKYDYIILITIK